jgi:PAS domain S-box-containing protein
MADQLGGESGLRAEIAAQQRRLKELEADVADLERTRVLLREEHSFREAVIERAAEGICVCHGIEDFPFVQFTVWNPRMTEMTGYTMEEINRRGWYQTVYPEPEIQERARKRMAGMREGEDLRNERWEITCANGSRKNVGISTSILTTEDG